jgi:hypothetical protein
MEIIDYGVCRLSLVPVRKDPADQSEQVTQLLFGDDYEVLEVTKDKKWVRIKNNFDQYEGWLKVSQHHSIIKEYFDHIYRAEFKISTDITSSLLYNKLPLTVLMGSIIPISVSELFKMDEQFAFNGDSKSLGLKREFEFLQTIAFRYLNAPYQWGGKSPFGIDCSGFTQMVFKICGYKLLRDAWQQANQGKLISSWHDAKPGDVAFFHSSEYKIIHTGIVLADHKIIHAHGRVRIDHINEEGILNLETKIYTHRLAHIRRMLT